MNVLWYDHQRNKKLCDKSKNAVSLFSTWSLQSTFLSYVWPCLLSVNILKTCKNKYNKSILWKYNCLLQMWKVTIFLNTMMFIKWKINNLKACHFNRKRVKMQKAKQSDLLLSVCQKICSYHFVHFCMWTRETWVTHSFEKCFGQALFLITVYLTS